MIPVTASLAIDERDLEERFVRAAGPGGQNVNKVSSAVELRFTLAGHSALPEDVLERLARLAGRRVSADGFLVIKAQRFRTQERNRDDALARLVGLIAAAAERPRERRATKVPKAQKQKRRDAKARRGELKANRARPGAED